MLHFKIINFNQNRPKVKLFLQKNTKFLSAKHPPLQISGYAPESNHVYVFAQLISMPAEFFFMPRLKSINFYQNKLKIKLFLQKIKFSRTGHSVPDPLWPPADGGEAPRPPKQPLSPLEVLLLYFQVLGTYIKKFLSLPNNNCYLQ